MTPITAFFARLLSGQAMSAAAKGIAGEIGKSAMSPATRALTTKFNSEIPNVCPGPESLLNVHYRGGLDGESLNNGLEWSGIAFKPRPDLGIDYSSYWQKIIDYGKPWPSQDEIIDMFLRGVLLDGECIDYLKRAGVPGGKWQTWLKDKSTPLNVDEIRYWFNLGTFDATESRRRMKMLGYQDTVDTDRIIERSLPPEPGGLLLLENRKFLLEGEFREDLGRNGYTADRDKDKYTELLKQIPSPSDLISFAVKEGWDAATVTKFQYDAEFPPEFQLWMERQGFGWDSLGVDSLGNPIPGPSWPKLWWRTHWRNISPQQAYELLHRCRGDKLNPLSWRIPGVEPFDASDVAEVLKINDYPVPFRDRLAAISYRIPTRIDIRRMVLEGLINDADAIEYYQDMGYTVADAVLLVKIVHATDRTSKLKAARQGARAAVRDSYRIGLMDYDTAAVQLKRLLATSDAEITAFDLLAGPVQLLNATMDPLVTSELQVIDIEQTKQLVNTAIAGIRRAYLHNEIDVLTANAQMINLGIQMPRRNQYIALWDAQRWGQGKDVTVARILKWVCKGKITVANGTSRLIQLGYSTIDASIMITEALDCAAADLAKLKKQTLKDAKDKADAIAKAIKLGEDVIKKAQAVLAKHGSPAQLARWFHLGVIGQGEATSRLLALGYPLVDAQRQLADPANVPPSESADLSAGIPTPVVAP